MVLAGALIGFGFITKMLQALILLPVLALVYLLAGPPKLGRRIVQLIYTGVALLVSGGWWVAAVQLTPAADRPYVGGSTNNSELNLIFGYNGFGRLTGNETGSVGGHGRPGSLWGPTGWNRLFLSSMGGQISWLIPGSLIGLVAVLWLTRRAPRTDRVRSAFLLFGGWLLLTGAVLQLRPRDHPSRTTRWPWPRPSGALVGMGASTLWRRRQEVFPRLALAAAILASIAWAFVILGWSPTWYPALRWVILFVGIAAALAIALVPRARGLLAAGIAGFGIASIIAAPGRLLAQHGGDAPQRSHTVSRATHRRGRWVRRPRWVRRRWVRPWRRWVRGPAPERDHPAQGVHAAQRNQAPQRVDIPAGSFPPAGGRRIRRAADRPDSGVDSAGGFGRGRRAGGPGGFGGGGGGSGWGRWAPRRVDARKTADRSAGGGRFPVFVGGGHHRIELRVGLPTGHRRSGHGHRRVQRDRSRSDVVRVRTVRRRRDDPLLPQWWRVRGRWLRRWRWLRWRGDRDHAGVPDRVVGDQPLHRPDGRRRDHLRPHRRIRLTEPRPLHRWRPRAHQWAMMRRSDPHT